MARNLGVDRFRVAIPFDVSWDDPSIRPAAVTPYLKRLDCSTLARAPENWNPFPDALESAAIEEAFSQPFRTHDASSQPNPGRTCHWLYKNMVMDAQGRILPCCGAPRPDADLVFSRFDGHNANLYNSEKYRQARTHFRQGIAGGPHCTKCTWDHDSVNIDTNEIRYYFRSADPAFFDRHSLHLLSSW